MRKYLFKLFLGFVIFLVGAAYFYIETIDYKIDTNLASNIVMRDEVLEYEISKDKEFILSNSNTNKNMQLIIDNNLDNKVKIEINYAEMLMLHSNYSTVKSNNKEVNRINLDSDLVPDWKNIVSLYDLGINSLNDKTIYNYNLLKYPLVRVYVHENYRANIKFVGKDGRVYNPVK